MKVTKICAEQKKEKKKKLKNLVQSKSNQYRGLFRTLSNMQDEAFLPKIVNGFQLAEGS